MALRDLRRKRHRQRLEAQHRFRRQRNANRLAAPGCHDFALVLDSLKPHFNIGKIFRSADAFGAREIHLVGIDFFDPAPAMGSFKYVPARFHATFADAYQSLRQEDYRLYTLEPAHGRPLHTVALPRRSAFIFGHEEQGLSFAPGDFPGLTALRIPQFGQVQSLNVSIAAAVVMWEYLRQQGLASRPPADASV
jgi:tRNA G18 (ribose-2'-O)-methylase SpoU